MYLDLHIHSYFSDGELSPEVIINKAKDKKVSLLSVTDHNFLSNTKKTQEIAAKNNIQYIDGIEISTLYYAFGIKLSLHILGYGKKLNRNILNKNLQQVINGYNYRAVAIIDKLNKLFPDIMLNFQSIQGNVHAPYVSRNTLARLVVGHLNNTLSIKDALRQYVFLEKENDSWMMSPKKSFELIINAGGIPVLAHSGGELQKFGCVVYEKMLVNLINEGLLGIEVYCSKHSKNEIKILRSFAKKFGLYITGGNDWHGEAYTPNISIGCEVPMKDIGSFLQNNRINYL